MLARCLRFYAFSNYKNILTLPKLQVENLANLEKIDKILINID